MTLKIWMSFFFAGMLNAAFSQAGWELTKEKNGIKVYTSKEPSSKFKEIRVEASVPGNIPKLVDILVNIGKTTGWVYGTKNSYIIKKISDNEILYYSETSLPWPVSNRDVPIRMQLKQDAKSNTLKVIAVGVPNAIPEKKVL